MSVSAAVAASLIAWTQATCDADSVEIVWLGVSDEALPDAEVWSWSGDPCRRRPTLRLAGYGAGEPVHLTLRPELDVWMRVPVAAHALDVGAPVDTVPGRVLIERIIGTPRSDGVARVAIAEGRPVTSANASLAPDVRAGSDVEIVVARGVLAISAPGRLLEDGQTGDEVRVVNHATQRVMRGVLVSNDTVEIR